MQVLLCYLTVIAVTTLSTEFLQTQWSKWVAPSFTRDESPHWSPDGNKIVLSEDRELGTPD